MINFVKRHFFTKKFSTFFILGIWNTIFGVGIFFVFYYYLHHYINYIFLVIIANILSITNAYIVYKIFVFKTRGNYLREYGRFYVVYGAVFLASILLFPLFMEIIFPGIQYFFPITAEIFRYKAYLAQLCCVSITMFISYFGHLNISYSDKKLHEIFFGRFKSKKKDCV